MYLIKFQTDFFKFFAIFLLISIISKDFTYFILRLKSALLFIFNVSNFKITNSSSQIYAVGNFHIFQLIRECQHIYNMEIYLLYLHNT